jgi:hypothetical protein
LTGIHIWLFAKREYLLKSDQFDKEDEYI